MAIRSINLFMEGTFLESESAQVREAPVEGGRAGEDSVEGLDRVDAHREIGRDLPQLFFTLVLNSMGHHEDDPDG